MSKKNTDFESTEVLSVEDGKISQMLGDLTRVGAPNDFDFRVKARIAAGKPTYTPSFWLPTAIRYVVPLVLLLAVGAYVGFNAFYSLKNADVPSVVETQPGVVRPIAPSPANDGTIAPTREVLSDQAGIKPPERYNTVPRTGTEPKVIGNSVVPKTKSNGGSFVEASKGNKPIFPRGFGPNVKPPKRPKDFDKIAQVPVKEILSLIGIEASFFNSNWKIDTVKEHSVADRSGLKAGDAVEAINEKAIDEKTTFGNKFSGKSLRVQRDGKLLEIVLKP